MWYNYGNMKGHHCHCGLKSQLAKLRTRKLGLLGMILFGLHLLFHVVECLILPAIIVGFSGHAHNHDTIAVEETAEVIQVEQLSNFILARPDDLTLADVGMVILSQMNQLQLHTE